MKKQCIQNYEFFYLDGARQPYMIKPHIDLEPFNDGSLIFTKREARALYRFLGTVLGEME